MLYISEQGDYRGHNHGVQKDGSSRSDRAWEQAKAYNGTLNESPVLDA